MERGLLFMHSKGDTLSLDEYLEMRQKTPISSCTINLTDDCNFRCKYCFTHHNPRKISLETMKKAVNFLIEEEKRTGVLREKPIAFFGGEPMLRYEDIIVPFVEWLNVSGLKEKHKILLSMTTNGSLFTDERLKFLSDNNVGILLSVDGDKFTQND